MAKSRASKIMRCFATFPLGEGPMSQGIVMKADCGTVIEITGSNLHCIHIPLTSRYIYSEVNSGFCYSVSPI